MYEKVSALFLRSDVEKSSLHSLAAELQGRAGRAASLLMTEGTGRAALFQWLSKQAHKCLQQAQASLACPCNTLLLLQLAPQNSMCCQVMYWQVQQVKHNTWPAFQSDQQSSQYMLMLRLLLSTLTCRNWNPFL